jgi:glucose/arabinose dehydrogenase
VAQKRGIVRVLNSGRLRREPFLDIQRLVGSNGPEQGLFSLAFHPRYAANHRFYAAYSDNRGDTHVVEYRSDGMRAVRRLRQLLYVRQPYDRHSAGQLQFGPDGRLWVSIGDGGNSGDPGNRGQKLATRQAKLLRIDVDKPGARWQVVGYGLRFPWRFSPTAASTAGRSSTSDRAPSWGASPTTGGRATRATCPSSRPA